MLRLDPDVHPPRCNAPGEGEDDCGLSYIGHQKPIVQKPGVHRQIKFWLIAEVWHKWLPQMAAGTDLALTVRLRLTGEFLGVAGLDRIGNPEPELGIWIKEQAQGIGYVALCPGKNSIAQILAVCLDFVIHH